MIGKKSTLEQTLKCVSTKDIKTAEFDVVLVSL